MIMSYYTRTTGQYHHIAMSMSSSYQGICAMRFKTLAINTTNVIMKYQPREKLTPQAYTRSCSSSHQSCSIRKGVLKIFAKFTGKHLCQSLFFNKVTGLRLSHWCFAVNFAKFSKIGFLQNTFGQLLLLHVTKIAQG